MILECVQCENEFELTADEMRFYESKGFDTPLRCHECRRKKKKTDQVPPPKSNKHKKKHNYRKFGHHDEYYGL